MAANPLSLTVGQINGQLVQRPAHKYWNSRVFEADRFLYSYVNRLEPFKYGGNAHALAAGDTAILAADIVNFDLSLADSVRNSIFTQHQAQDPAGDIEVDAPSAASIITAGGMIVGDYFEFAYANQSSNAITIDGTDNGLTEVGNMVIAANITARFRIAITVIGSGLEAGTITRVN